MILENRSAVIAGAGGKLGTYLANQLISRGARLALLGDEPGKLRKVVESLKYPKSQVLTYSVDLIDERETKPSAESLIGKFGSIHIVLHLV